MTKKFLTDVKNWKLSDPKLVLAKLNKDVPTAPKTLWILDDTLSPFNLYCYLNVRFWPA